MGAGLGKFIRTLQLDTRLLGMIGAFLLIALVFNVATGGTFLTPRNIFNLTLQTASVAVMATGMVFIIVTRNIDLSIGSMVGVIGMVMGLVQAFWLPEIVGFGSPVIWIVTVIIGVALGVAIGALQGWMVGYLMIPSFIVTLGGLLIWRGAAWWVTRGTTVSPLDPTFIKLGGASGTIGVTASWILAGVAILATVWFLIHTRRSHLSHGFAVKPLWAEYTLGAILVGAIAGITAVINAYEVPTRVLQRRFQREGLEMPEGYTEAYGFPISVLIVIGIAIAMTIVARKTRFGRYVFAMGGNPDAAELSGINTKMLTVKVFALMGGLAAVAAVIASARLASAGNDLGTLDELRVIAAAVIGGTALAGGVGTIYGALLGAFIMQSLVSGMGMVGVDAPFQNIIVGAVLILAVWVDIVYRRRTGDA
ncbi:sugar ABC transporter permease [Jannaschia pagri]|uniref:Xylose transport system permease protein XylH n=1 Tax=Jannaschia pagri TaxID=2829797 RepID=A0ABQ4NP13_9RHOB|nr:MULTISPECIES: sugar ABC transporter permease [unclassified Jannaschia]GIT91998.1 sugar ABC transporter permease [Jannaschia sp. AI_61]GIT95832.1 sugar ABC transporter permease [Jannaschia sp. AI_62]